MLANLQKLEQGAAGQGASANAANAIQAQIEAMRAQMTKGVDAMMEDSKAAEREVQEIKGKVAEKKLAKIRAQAALAADKKRAKAEAGRAVRAESSKVAKARRQAKQKV